MALIALPQNGEFPRPQSPRPLDHYDPGSSYCELLGAPGNKDRALGSFGALWRRLQELDPAVLAERARDAEHDLFTLGVTFTVYNDRNAIDRILPFDVIPRVLPKSDWRLIDAGIKQRVKAINLFLWDVYHDRHILRDGVLPADLVLGNPNYRPEMVGYDPPAGTYAHIAGTDIIRNSRGDFMVLEDNCRTPSGVSYVVENRHLMQRAFPDLMEGFAIESGVRLRLASGRQAGGGGVARRGRAPASCCCRRASSTRPISSTCFSPAKWAFPWWKAAIWWWTTTGST